MLNNINCQNKVDDINNLESNKLRGLTKLFKKLIKGYQKYISSFLPARCRYYPTCSQYGLQALTWHGVGRGSLLTIKRICRCHPLGGHGIDFVPLPLYRFTFNYINPEDEVNTQFIRQLYVYITPYSYTHHLNNWLNKPF